MQQTATLMHGTVTHLLNSYGFAYCGTKLYGRAVFYTPAVRHHNTLPTCKRCTKAEEAWNKRVQ